jgi:hypothetical protein
MVRETPSVYLWKGALDSHLLTDQLWNTIFVSPAHYRDASALRQIRLVHNGRAILESDHDSHAEEAWLLATTSSKAEKTRKNDGNNTGIQHDWPKFAPVFSAMTKDRNSVFELVCTLLSLLC